MKICVVGFGHFAQIIGACLRQKGHGILQTDYEPFLKRADQREARDEPGWEAMAFPAIPPETEDFTRAGADLCWIAYDVPLDAAGAPVTTEILARIRRTDDEVPKSIPFLVSCQWPVGTTRTIAAQCPGREFVYVMENVRAGKAIEDFRSRPLPVVGVVGGHPYAISDIALAFITDLFGPPLMLWESAEFAKHSLNAFLALQIAFVNELARIAPHDVNMADVTRVLKSDPRVSPLAPLTAGPAFGGGSLKRDLLVLETLKPEAPTPIIDAILVSNDRR